MIPLGSPDAQEDAVVGTRRTTLAARLKAIYGTVDKLDAFVGMVSEQHVSGTEFGELQLAIWKQQFAALRDGDRFFYANDPALRAIEQVYGINYRHTLAELIALNTGARFRRTSSRPPGNMPESPAPAMGRGAVSYSSIRPAKCSSRIGPDELVERRSAARRERGSSRTARAGSRARGSR